MDRIWNSAEPEHVSLSIFNFDYCCLPDQEKSETLSSNTQTRIECFLLSLTRFLINLQSLEDTQVGYISQKYTLDKYTLEKYT